MNESEMAVMRSAYATATVEEIKYARDRAAHFKAKDSENVLQELLEEKLAQEDRPPLNGRRPWLPRSDRCQRKRKRLVRNAASNARREVVETCRAPVSLTQSSRTKPSTTCSVSALALTRDDVKYQHRMWGWARASVWGRYSWSYGFWFRTFICTQHIDTADYLLISVHFLYCSFSLIV